MIGHVSIKGGSARVLIKECRDTVWKQQGILLAS